MQLRLALLDLDLVDPPTSLIPTNPPTTSWEQIDEVARIAALELVARLIAQMLVAHEAKEVPDE
jgi:hypothetical protein